MKENSENVPYYLEYLMADGSVYYDMEPSESMSDAIIKHIKNVRTVDDLGFIQINEKFINLNFVVSIEPVQLI